MNWGTPYVSKFVDYGVDMNILEDNVFDLDSMMGKLGKIPQGGYAINIDMNNKTAAFEMAHALKDAGYISLNTIAVVLEFVLVNREINIITSSRFACEFSTSGYVVTSFRMRSAKLSDWSNNHDALLLSLQLLLYCVFIIRVSAWIRSMCVLAPIIDHIQGREPRNCCYAPLKKDAEEAGGNRTRSCCVCFCRRRQEPGAPEISTGGVQRSKHGGLHQKSNASSWGSINVTKIDRNGSVLESSMSRSSNTIDYDGADEGLFSGGDRGCCCITCCRRAFRSVCKPASREAHMDKIQRSGGYMIDLPCFKFGKGSRLHRWDSEGRVSPHMQASMYSQSEMNVLTSIKRGSCGYRTIWCSARAVLGCYRCVYCARFVHSDTASGGKRTKQRRSRRNPATLRETGCCGYTELDHVDLDNFLVKMDRDEVTPMIVETKYHFMPFPYSQTISRGYGSFVCQSKLWEVCLMAVYGVLIGLHIRELLWYKQVDLKATTYDNHLEASIFYSQLRVILLGLLSTLTLFEFMVWISKVYRTTAVLFMVVEEVRFSRGL
jgi:hypothetical protein